MFVFATAPKIIRSRTDAYLFHCWLVDNVVTGMQGWAIETVSNNLYAVSGNMRRLIDVEWIWCNRRECNDFTKGVQVSEC